MLAKLFLTAVLLAILVVSRVEVSRGASRELVAPPASLVHFTFGYREAMADLFWIRAIQDFDYCENKINKNLCQGNSWLYKTLDLVTELSPNFRMAYSAGSMALTIIISDIEGASKFFDKMVLRFPKDWRLLYKAAYHALYEENNKPKAGGLMEQAAANGAPDWVYSLASRLYSEGGKIEVAERLLQQLEQNNSVDDMLAAWMRKKIEEERLKLQTK